MQQIAISNGTLGRRASLGAMALLATMLIYAGSLTGPVAGASADTFCPNVTLAPYGHYGDRCYAWEWEGHPYLAVVTIETNERAGCVTSASTISYDLKESWYCIGNGSYGMKYVSRTSESRRGVIRNNNLTYSGRFLGTYTCCWDH